MMFHPGLPKDRRELPDRFCFGAIEVDVPGVRVWRDGAPLALEPKAFDVLLLLAANSGRVVGKDELIERVWADAGVSDNALTRVIAQLRRELGDDVGEARYIGTVRTRGYRFLPEVEAADPAAPRPAPPQAEDSAPPPAVSGAAAAPLQSEDNAPAPAAATPHPARPAGRGVGLGLGAGFAVVLAGLAAVWLLRGGAGRRAPAYSVSGAPVQLSAAPGYEGQPSFSPGGAEIVYVGERASGLELVVRGLDGGAETAITSGEVATDPAWSPDGRWIAYHSILRGGIWLVSPRGGEPRRVTEFGAQPAWSPDSRRLVFRSQEGPDLSPWAWAGAIDSVLWTVDVEAGIVERLTRPGSTLGGHGMPAWSPDGRTIVFAAGEYEAAALYCIPADGGTPHPLAPVPEPGGPVSSQWGDPVFTPDGRSVLALRSGRSYSIVRVDVRTGAVETILPIAPSGINALTLSADGRRLAWTVTESDSSVVEAPVGADGRRTGAARDLVRGGRQRVSGPSYAPGGERLVYSRRRAGAIADLELLDLGTLASRLLLAEGGRGTWLSPGEVAVWGPPLRAIEIAGGRRREVPGGREAAAVAAQYSASSRSWSPGLRRLAFAGRVGDTVEIFALTVGDTEARQVTHLGSFAHYPAWSPDSSAIAFQLAGVEGSRSEQLWIVRADGADPRVVTSAMGRSWSVVFSPDARRLGYAAQRGGRWDIATVDIATGTESLFGVNDSWTTYVRWLDWSPRGDAIAYESTRIVGDVWVLSLPESQVATTGPQVQRPLS